MSSPALLRQLQKEVGALVESHARSQRATDFSAYRDDPIGFIESELHSTLTEKQKEIALAVLSNRQVVVRSCNSAGKDFLGARLALWWAVCRNGLAVLSGATVRQVQHVLFKELGRAFRSNRKLPGELFQLALRIDGEEKILGFTGDSIDKLVGFHDPNVLVIITELQGCEPGVIEAAQACATSENSRILGFGNPLRTSGVFYKISKSSNWHSLRISALEHPNVLQGREVIPGGVTLEWVESIAREYGRDSSQYRARVEGEFPEDGDIDALLTREQIDRATQLWSDPAFHVRANNRGRIISADIARGGPDSSCMMIGRGPLVESIEAFREGDLMRTAEKIFNRSLEIGAINTHSARPTAENVFKHRCLCIIDDCGLGGGVTDRLRDLNARVDAFNGGSAAHNDKRFANRRAEAYFTVRERVIRGDLAFPPDELLIEELLATGYTTDKRGKIVIESKDMIRQNLGRSPDRADTLSMLYAPRRETHFFTYYI